MAIKMVVLGREIEFEPELIMPPAIRETIFPSISSLALDVSGRCNMRCRYCAEYITMPSRPVMSLDMLQKAVDSLFEWSANRGISIHFGSGEPLLQPQAVLEVGRRARERARKERRSLSLHITTNGTMLSDEIVGQLVKDEWNVKVSLDGSQALHDLYRVAPDGSGTYRRIEGQVRALARAIPGRLSTTSVLCHGTDPSEVFTSISSLGVRNIEMVPVAAPAGSDLILNQDDLTRYGRFVIHYTQRLASGEELPNLISFRKRLQRALGHGNARVPCGAGRNFFAVGQEGAIFPCFRFIGIQAFNLGDIVQGISKEKVERFVEQVGRPMELRSECRQCWASTICGGPCFAVAELMGQGIAPVSQCAMVRAEGEAALWLADSLKEKDPERLVALMGARLDD
jgi:uncharacterized protein